MNRNYFFCSVGANGEGYDDDNYERCLNNNAHFMNKATTYKDVFEEVKANDIVFLKYKNNLTAYGEVLKSSKSDDQFLKDGWTYRIDVKKWVLYDKQKKISGVSNYGVQANTISGNSYDTIKKIDPEFAIKKMKEIDENSALYQTILKEKAMNDNIKFKDEIKTLLENTKILVLTGAPGTGKTYLARNIAAKMMFGKDNYSGLLDDQKKQIGYVQFHQSYDYTDFVEGLRPVSDNSSSNTIGFERKDGIFKKFCSEVVENNVYKENYKNNDNKENNNILGLFDELVNDIIECNATDTPINITMRNKKNSEELYDITADTEKNIIFFKLKVGKGNSYPVYKYKILELSKFFKNKESLNNLDYVYDEFKKIGFGAYHSYYYAVLYKLYEMKEDNIKGSNNSFDNKQISDKYVFIIDEINRGEVSKIFGELFNAIDPGYRGVNGKIQTQYKELIPDYDIFKDGFYVPENVYIIATMNDIDRSVESMDFAFRRRFAWREIKAIETQNMLDNDDELDSTIVSDAKNKMNSLNDAIEKIEGLSSSYHIGAAYFLKLKDYKDDVDKGFNSLWEYHLKPLLQEYLRGMNDIEEKLENLQNAYNLKKENNNPSDTQQTDTND